MSDDRPTTLEPSAEPLPMANPRWIAHLDEEAPGPYRWQPCLHLGPGLGLITCRWLWFDSPEVCEEWMRNSVVGAQVQPHDEAIDDITGMLRGHRAEANRDMLGDD